MKRWITEYRILGPVLFLLLLLIVPKSSASDNTETHQQSLLIVRGDGYYPPNEMVEAGELIGIHIEMIRSVAQQLNINVHFSSVPWRRAVRMLESGPADAITYMRKTPERELFGLFLEGNILSNSQNAFFVLKDRHPQIIYGGDLKNLAGMTFGVLQGYSYDDLFDNVNYLDKLDIARNEEQLLTLLLAKRIDVAVANVERFRFIAHKEKLFRQIRLLTPPLTDNPTYLVFSRQKKLNRTAQRFADKMAQYKRSNAYKKLINRYGAE